MAVTEAPAAPPVETVDDFDRLVREVEARPGYRRPAAFALGIATFGITDPAHPAAVGQAARTLDTYYPVVNLGENYGAAAVLARSTGYTSGSATFRLERRQVEQALACFAPFLVDGAEHPNLRVLQHVRDLLAGPGEVGEAGGAALAPRAVVATFIEDLAAPPVDAHDVYLRLHLLSYRKVKPHGLNLDGIFGLLNNVVWTNLGPFDPESFEQVRLRLRTQGVDVKVRAIDKIPRMTDYVIPSGVRLAEADHVRLGAYLSEGTTVMPAGAVNFNAGTLGASMVEGRISAGVVVGNGTDIGGGASIMGTLSGGGTIVISVGENCLLGANSGIGISLGNGCTVDAGLYVTSGTKVTLPDGRIVKALELSGHDDLHFRRDSVTGTVRVIAKKNQVVLNEALHRND